MICYLAWYFRITNTGNFRLMTSTYPLDRRADPGALRGKGIIQCDIVGHWQWIS